MPRLEGWERLELHLPAATILYRRAFPASLSQWVASLSPRDRQRLFTRAQRRELLTRTHGKCAHCHAPLRGAWHAHHVRSHAEGGPTTLDNGIPLCRACHVVAHRASRRMTSRALETHDRALLLAEVQSRLERLKQLVVENGRLRALEQHAGTHVERLERDLFEARARVAELEALRSRRWWRR